MPTISTGRVSVTPFRAETSATIEELRRELGRMRPDTNLLSAGWAALDSSDSGIGVFGAVPQNLTPPVVQVAEGQYPERLVARFYHWVHDPKRDSTLESAGISPTPLQTHRLEAVDMIVSKESQGDGYLVLVSTRTEDELAMVVAAAHAAALRVDPDAVFDVKSRSSISVSGDFFLWTLERKIRRPIVDPGLTLASINGLDTRDNRHRQSFLKDEIDGDRPNFLIAVADGHELGPMRFMIRIPTIPARITLELWSDGSFLLLTGSTHYSIKAGVQNEPLRAVQDLAFVLIPRLLAFYRADSDWSTSRRLAFRTDARVKLEQKYRV